MILLKAMEVKLALLADYANVTKEGKLNVMGLFTAINAPVLPWIHPQMQLIIEFEASPAEWNSHKEIEIKLLDVDAKQLLSIKANLTVPKGKSGKRSQINSIMAFGNVRFESEGDYVFAIMIGGDVKKELPFSVTYAPPSSPPPSSSPLPPAST